MVGKTRAVSIPNQARNGKKLFIQTADKCFFFITEDMDNQIGKTTDTLKNIWEQALKTPDL